MGFRLGVRAEGGKTGLTLYNLRMQVELEGMRDSGLVVTVQAAEFQRVFVLP